MKGNNHAVYTHESKFRRPLSEKTKEEIKQEINKEDQIHRMVENHKVWESSELVNCFRL